MNDPVTVLSALITIEHGLVGPVQSPLQPVKFDPDARVAGMLTVAPSSQVADDGFAAKVPYVRPTWTA